MRRIGEYPRQGWASRAAARLCVEPSTLTHWQNGTCPPGVTHFVAISDIARCSLDWLVLGVCADDAVPAWAVAS